MKDFENKQAIDCPFPADPSDLKPKVYESPQLFGCYHEIHIYHEGELYRIRITRNGKLVMNK